MGHESEKNIRDVKSPIHNIPSNIHHLLRRSKSPIHPADGFNAFHGSHKIQMCRILMFPIKITMLFGFFMGLIHPFSDAPISPTRARGGYTDSSDTTKNV